MRTITDAGVGIYRDMVNSMLAIDHETVWIGEENGFLIFTTINPESATKAIQALKEAGVLCSTEAGKFESTLFIKETVDDS